MESEARETKKLQIVKMIPNGKDNRLVNKLDWHFQYRFYME